MGKRSVLRLLVGPYTTKLGVDDYRFLLALIPFPIVLFMLLASMLVVITLKAIPILAREGLAIYLTSVWKAVEEAPEQEFYGVLPAIWGSIYTGLIAVIVGAVLSINFAVLVEEIAPSRLRGVLTTLMDVMAALPTIVYGLWGAAYLAPFMKQYVLTPLHEYLGWLPFFSAPPVSGYTIATAGVLLGIMVTPYTAAVIREAYAMIPKTYVEAAYSLGATTSEVIKIKLGMIKPAIIAGLVLAFGRAIGETVAVALVVGNSMSLTLSVTSPGITVASLIASMFKSAAFYEYMESALFAAGLALFLIGFTVNLLGILMVKKWEERIGVHM